MKTLSSASITETEARRNGELILNFSGDLIDLYRHLGVSHPKFHKMDRLSQLGFLGAHLLLDPIKEELTANDEAVAIVIANTSSSIETDRTYWSGVGDEGTGSPAKFVYTLPNIVIGEICIYWKQFGETQFLVLPEFNEERMMAEAELLLSNSSAKYVLAGWAEVNNTEVDCRFMLLGE